MHLLIPNVTNVYTIGESIFLKVLEFMNPQYGSHIRKVVYYGL